MKGLLEQKKGNSPMAGEGTETTLCTPIIWDLTLPPEAG